MIFLVQALEIEKEEAFEDGSLTVDLQALLAGVYRRARYHLAIDYERSVRPTLSDPEKAWVATRLKAML